MPSFDIFNDDAFGLTSLTETFNTVDYQPGRIGQLGLFQEAGIATTSIMVENVENVLKLVESRPRSAPGKPYSADKRKLIPLSAVHLPTRATVQADEVQNVRAFGSETDLQMVQTVVNERLEEMAVDLEVTLEYHRIGAIKGQVLDADGSTVLRNLFTDFGVSQQTHDMALDVTTTNVRGEIVKAKRKSEDGLGSGIYRGGFLALCSASFWDAFTGHGSVAEAFDRWMSGEWLRTDVRTGFAHGGVQWEEYVGSVGGVDFIPDGEAYLIPLGVRNMFVTKFAPANYIETANTRGLPRYAKQEMGPMGKYVEIEGQSNPLCFNTRPRAVIKLTAS